MITKEEAEGKRIHQYVKKGLDNKKRVVGVLVAEVRDGDLRFGWSRANSSKGDKYDRDFGMNLAIKRLNAKTPIPIPHSFGEPTFKFMERCCKYFKHGVNFPNIPVQELPKEVEEKT